MCFDFPKTRGEDCNEVIEDYLESSGFNNFKFVGFYTKESDLINYKNTFKNNNYTIEKLVVDENLFYYLVSKWYWINNPDLKLSVWIETI